ncbi:hypothetical protein F8G81_11650 [Arthrobacter sp. CDRTa11]|uniref:hypothetical protein n=1 Tax=Arthrobacter sp. CDRTa11 TaxID=2651199 RepID=UPI002265D75E|nr:hypothetical protein [Arthrobacter sp. CDRTa11]UZX03182.1 hypothetical protein F8G81_11650 [Arthrobacter sp. CDRTa11]
MIQPEDSREVRESQHFKIISEIVGDAIARDDLPAVERAYTDFRSGMDQLRRTFESVRAEEERDQQ